MKTFTVITESSMFWSTKKLTEKVESTLTQKSAEGYDIVSVSFSYNLWGTPTAYITLSK